MILEPEAKILVCIFTCRKNLATKVEAVRLTWLPRLPSKVEVLIFVGGGQVEAREENIVTLTCGDGYVDLGKKTWALLNYCNRNCDFDYLIKIDDDTYIPDVKKWLSGSIRGDYIGRKRKPTKKNSFYLQRADVNSKAEVPQHLLDTFYMVGQCYSLSRKSVACICKLDPTSVEELNIEMAFEDIMIGRLLSQFPSIEWVDKRNFLAGPAPWFVVRRGLLTPTVIVDLTAEEISLAHELNMAGKRLIFLRLFLRKQVLRVLGVFKASKG